MAADEALFNATLVLIPVWLGVIRYIINHTDFEDENIANIVGLSMVFVLIGVLFSMWVAITQLVAKSEGLKMGLYVLYVTIGLTGIGGVLFIIREIDKISGRVVTGIPVGIIIIGIGIIILPRIVRQLPSASVPRFLSFVSGLIGAIGLRFILDLILNRYIYKMSDRIGGEGDQRRESDDGDS